MMKNEEPEFKVGQIVSYKPYSTAYPAKVTEVSFFDFWGNPTKKPRYRLNSTDDPNDKPVVAHTSGLTIVESKHFVDYDEIQAMIRGQVDPMWFNPAAQQR